MLRTIKSFVKRDSRMTLAERDAMQRLWPLYGIAIGEDCVHFSEIFQREAPRILEIGFGAGHSLLQMAAQHLEKDFMGVEMYQPGVGAVLLGIEKQQLKNLRVFYADAVEVLKRAIPDDSLAGVQIFFPDPWPKRKHHKRRLIQTEFVALVARKLKDQGVLHLATDWEDYALHMMRVMSLAKNFLNDAGPGNFSERSEGRPLVTKFESRGIQQGRKTWELQFVKHA